MGTLEGKCVQASFASRFAHSGVDTLSPNFRALRHARDASIRFTAGGRIRWPACFQDSRDDKLSRNSMKSAALRRTSIISGTEVRVHNTVCAQVEVDELSNISPLFGKV